jgi:hypothetical protein
MMEQALLVSVLDQVAKLADRPENELLTDLRSAFAGIHLSVCRDDDMPARLKPAAGNDFCRLYYVQSGGHCLQLTDHAEAASGLVVALTDQDGL